MNQGLCSVADVPAELTPGRLVRIFTHAHTQLLPTAVLGIEAPLSACTASTTAPWLTWQQGTLLWAAFTMATCC